MVAITVLLPIYNGAAYLEETLVSLTRQSFASFEVLCIDDCSTDESRTIIERHASQDARIRYLNSGKNLGCAARAANFAAPHAKGRWFVYSSQDDLFSQDWLAQLHARMIETGADAVVPDVVFYHADGTDDRKIVGYQGDRSKVLTGREAFVASLDWTIAGNALWPILFLKNTGFDEFNAFADEYSVRRFFLACETVAFCGGVFYYRQDNATAITKDPSPALLDAADTNFRLWHLIHDNGFGPDIHGPFASITLRSTIRAQAMIFNTPRLQPEASRVAEVWKAMQVSAPFHGSLEAAGKSTLKQFLYRRAVRSFLWFLQLARLSAWMARRKQRTA